MAINEGIVSKIKEEFQRRFKEKPLIVRSPGRVNIIGEHTDYNNGFVLPAAIDKAVYVAASPRMDSTIHLYSGEFRDEHVVTIGSMEPVKKTWPNYILGVVDQLVKRGFGIRGFNLVIDGDVPIGSGLSSSAAVECATAFALNELFGLQIKKPDLALLAQKAEHEYAKVMCGIMDQFASVFGKKNHVIRLDCKSLDYEYVPLDLKGYKILLLNSNVKHSLASTAYNTRRQECEQGVKWMQQEHPGVHSLRDANMEMVEKIIRPKDAVIYSRCKYVVEENERLLSGCEDLKHNDLAALGKKMFRTHDGLSKEYEVSCPELDFLVDTVRNNPGVIGARMMGGGFGGCTINIVKESSVESLVNEISSAYEKTMHQTLTPYIAVIEDGTGIVP